MAAAKITVARADLERFIADIFRARGLSGEDAGCIAEVLVWANLRGIESHGIARVPRYLQFIDLGDLQPGGKPQIHRLGEALFHLDAARAAGAVAMQRAVATAVEMVPSTGVCLGIVSHTTHAGAIGLYALRLAEQGYAALVIAAGMPNMAYVGTRTASLSTSPIAIAVPGRQYGPLVLDMATAVAAAGRINQARLAGEPLPDGWALAKDGQPTTDPARADIAMPLGGAKGSGLSFMFECLTGLVPAAPILLRAVGATGPRRNAQNLMLLALDVARFRPLDEFCRDVDALATLMKSQPRRSGVDEILLPGERGRRTAAVRERDGIPISARVWQQLCEVAAALELSLPPARDA